MTSRDHAGRPGAPAVIATPRPLTDGEASAPRPSPADLCLDSDDLLTSRRGLAAGPAEAASAATDAPADQAGIPFSGPAFDGGEAAATPLSPEAEPPAAGIGTPDVPASGAPAAPAEAVDAAQPGEPEMIAAPDVSGEAATPTASPTPAADQADAAERAASSEAAPPELQTAAEPAALVGGEPSAPADGPIAREVAAPTAPADAAPAWEEPPAPPAPEASAPAEQPGDVISPTPAATAAPPDAGTVEPRFEDATVASEPAAAKDDPFAALPIPEDVEQAAVASCFAAWLPAEQDVDEDAPSTAPGTDATAPDAPAEPPAPDEGERAAGSAPTMGVPLLTALGLADDAAGTHTNGHTTAHEAAPTPAASTERTVSLHEQETREVATELGAAEPAATAAQTEDPAAIIAAMLQPSEPAGGVAVAEAPLSVVTLPSGNEAADAVIELPRADSLSTETEPIAVAAPPAEPPAEPPAPPASPSPPPPPAAPLPDEEEEEGATMTIIEHLEELRKRITISAIGIVVCAIVSWFFVPHFVNLLEADVRSLGFKFVNLSPLGPLGLNIKLAFLGGLILASPIVFYEIWAFVAPGLTRKERHYALPFSLIGGALFAIGAATAIVIIPLALRFLVSFYPVFDLENMLSINDYIMFIALIAVIFGITFELPIFMVGFSLLGIVNSRFFIQKFKLALFIMYGAAMVITPGADFVSPLVLGTFLVALYWLGVLLIRFIGK